MGPGLRRVIVLAVASVALSMFVPLAGAREHDQGQGADCSQSSTGAIPIPDLGSGTYQGVGGGLYPGGSNAIPSDHEVAGLLHASQIELLDAQGNPDPDGAIVLVSLGVSNTWREFQDFMTIVETKTAPGVELVNASQAGEPIARWVDALSPTWAGVDSALDEAGLSGDQVQVAWVKIPERILTWSELEPFPIDAQTYQADLIKVLRIAKDRYPNLHIAYISSRIYGGYSTEAFPSPEPLTYENGFGVKWVIEQQINGVAHLNHDPGRGSVEAPWIAWGPYLWADGTTPRSDGLTWECSDVRRDGTHPTESGVRKVAMLLADHFLSASTAAPWFSATGEPIDTTALPPSTDRQADAGEVHPESTTTTSAPTEEPRSAIPVVTTTLDGETRVREAQGRPVRGSEGSLSTDRGSSTLVLLATALSVTVIIGVLAIMISRRDD